MKSVKTCIKCGSEKPLAAFAPHSKYKDSVYLKNVCRQCDSARRMQQHNAIKDEPSVIARKRQFARAGYAKNMAHGSEGREWRHLRLVLRRRGLTLDQFHAMYENQDFLCPICGDDLVIGGKTGAAVDHCHRVGRVRGILCSKCNLGLGLFRDTPTFLEAAARYLAG